MSNGLPNMNGKDVTVSVFRDGNPLKDFAAKSFQLKVNGTEISDPVLGADRDDLDFREGPLSREVKPEEISPQVRDEIFVATA